MNVIASLQSNSSCQTLEDTSQIDKANRTDLKGEVVNIHVDKNEVIFHKYEDPSSPNKSRAKQEHNIEFSSSDSETTPARAQNQKINSQASPKQNGKLSIVNYQ